MKSLKNSWGRRNRCGIDKADAEAGKLDQLAEEALRDYREGKYPAPVKLGSSLSPKFFDTYRHLPPGIRAKARESY